jgi:endonuclease-3
VSYPATERLFARAADPAAIGKLKATAIERLIYPVGFYRRKAAQIREICRLLLAHHAGAVPRAMEDLLALPGVGRKTANLVITLGFSLPGICVDTHVHRISNRLGWVRTKHAHETEEALMRLLARRHWIPVNEILVRHGQTVCKPISPLCSVCPVRIECPKHGVGRRR